MPIHDRAEVMRKLKNSLYLVVNNTVYHKLVDAFYSPIADLIVFRARLQQNSGFNRTVCTSDRGVICSTGAALCLFGKLFVLLLLVLREKKTVYD